MTLIFEPSSRFDLLLAHDLFRKPVPTFRDHALRPAAARHLSPEIVDRDLELGGVVALLSTGVAAGETLAPLAERRVVARLRGAFLRARRCGARGDRRTRALQVLLARREFARAIGRGR